MNETTLLRRGVVGLLIALAVGTAVGRILSSARLYEPSLFRDPTRAGDRRTLWPGQRPPAAPLFSSNDRSRWATIRSLVDEGTYIIGRRDRNKIAISAIAPLGHLDPLQTAVLAQAGFYSRTGKSTDPAMSSDRGIIFEPGWESVDKVLHPTRQEFISSKPPFLATLLSGLYWVLQKLTGWTLASHPNEMIRLLLLLTQGLPFLFYLVVLSRLADRYGRSDWAKVVVVGIAGLGSLLGPFLLSLNNHVFGTCSTAFALGAMAKLWEQRKAGQPLSVGYLFLAGFFAGFTVANEMPALAFAAALFVIAMWWSPGRALVAFLPGLAIPVAFFFATNYAAVGHFRPAYTEFGGIWYEYEGSHWRTPPGLIRPGIDFARQHESLGAYAFHLLLGHHGWLSLTPVFLLALWSFFRVPGDVPRALKNEPERDGLPPFWLPLTFAVSVAVIGFYLFKSTNYGGWSNGPRWLMWLTPMWLISLLPALESLGTTSRGRGFSYVLVAFSAVSANYVAWNPWRHPWIFDLMDRLGWIPY